MAVTAEIAPNTPILLLIGESRLASAVHKSDWNSGRTNASSPCGADNLLFASYSGVPARSLKNETLIGDLRCCLRFLQTK
jgi:hypothetical protein